MADERALAGRWHEAAGLYDRAIARGPVPYEVWFHAAIAHLEIGDEGGYRRLCEALRDRHPAAIPQIFVSEFLAGVCLLGAGGAGDDGRAVGWAEGAVAGLPARLGEHRHAYLNTLAAVLYRADRYGEAFAKIDEGIALDGGQAMPEDVIFRAMAYHRTGEAARARATLAGLPSDVADGPPSAYWDIRGLRLLRREAIRLILDADFPADPFTP